jgi:hypothetical protein
MDENPAVAVPNPEPKRREVPAFATLAEVEQVAVELGPRFGAVAIVGASLGYGPKSGSRWSVVTSARASSMFAASTPTGK